MKCDLLEKLDIMIPDPKCELNYNKDYELLIATVLSAQCTDARVNMVTKELFSKYDIYSLAAANINDIKKIIKSVGTYTRKSEYIIEIAKRLVNDYNGKVPNDRKYLESLPGVGRKTCNVVLSNIYDVPTIAVDTHVERVSKRLNLVRQNDGVIKVENKLMKKIPKNKWSRFHHQMVLFGRYICKSKNPDCKNCLLNNECKYYLRTVKKSLK
ncbi:MAG TPA: endonuclease III [Bacilli bacterium]|nr:endonuclease III [Bacilli bacterium]